MAEMTTSRTSNKLELREISSIDDRRAKPPHLNDSVQSPTISPISITFAPFLFFRNLPGSNIFLDNGLPPS